MTEIEKLCLRAKEASALLGLSTEEERNDMLKSMSDAVMLKKSEIMQANELDIAAGREAGMPEHLIDRLTLNVKRIESMSDGIRQIIKLADPVGDVMEYWIAPVNKLLVKKVRVPLGVVGIIYEARPNVTVDTAALCIKSGNAVVLRGSKDAINSNMAIAQILRAAIANAGYDPECIQLIPDTTREGAAEFMRMDKYINVLVPRGSKGLIMTAKEQSTIPVIETGTGNCHIYVNKFADLKMATQIAVNAKVSRPSVCNAAESLLIDEEVYKEYLPVIGAALRENGTEIRGCNLTREMLDYAIVASDEDYYTEFLGNIISVKVVKDYKEAIGHINKYGSQHSDAIITNDEKIAQVFTRGVDSAAVYVNASTRFTDGGEFGFGAELGISTQKLHARGPVGLKELTSYKYVVFGEGQTR